MAQSEKKISSGNFRTLFFSALLVAGSSVASAGDISGGSYGLSANVPGAESMTISGPRGFSAQSDSSYLQPEALPNGSYRYEIYGAVAVQDDPYDAKRKMNNGRSEEKKAENRRSKGVGVIASGHFRVKNGEVFQPGNETEE